MEYFKNHNKGHNMHSIKYNNKTYTYEPTCDGYTFATNKLKQCKYQLFGVVLDNQKPFIIGVIHSNDEWLPMKWDLYTGEHYDGGFNLTPIKDT